MTSREEALAELAEARASYRGFIESVDEDLRAERERRIAQRRAEIEGMVLRAYALESSIADIKRAWGTKDYRTIRNIIDSRSSELDALREELAQAAEPDSSVTPWLTFPWKDGLIVHGEFYRIIELQDDEGFLLVGDNDEPLDGAILDGDSTGENKIIYETIKEGWPNND